MSFKRYQDIVNDYDAYVEAQKVKYCSHEIQVPRWEQGQQRYMEAVFSGVDRGARILDIACGDGVGLRQFRRLGFTNVVGVEFNDVKLAKARETGYEVVAADMHDLSIFPDGSFHIVYSSHTLEHAYRPSEVLAGFRRILVPHGNLFVVLPYPDVDRGNEEAHGAKYELGTDVADEATRVIEYFTSRGFELVTHVFDTFREPEIWLFLARTPD